MAGVVEVLAHEKGYRRWFDARHVTAARVSWLGIGRVDLAVALDKELGPRAG